MKKPQRPLCNILRSDEFTPFEKRVLKAASRIPYGQIRTYKWIAERAGRPRAYRAVGQALKKNPYLGIIPCHRVIKSYGSIGGFSKGIKRKKQLLKSEGIMI